MPIDTVRMANRLPVWSRRWTRKGSNRSLNRPERLPDFIEGLTFNDLDWRNAASGYSFQNPRKRVFLCLWGYSGHR